MSEILDFKNHPPSIGEIRSDKTHAAADWTPRDALISLLREIDNGLKVEALVISYTLPLDQPKPVRFITASKDILITRGLLLSTILKTENR